MGVTDWDDALPSAMEETRRTPKNWVRARNPTPDSYSVGRRTTGLLCPPLCPRQAETHPKLPHASQTQKENPSANQRLTEGLHFILTIKSQVLYQLS